MDMTYDEFIALGAPELPIGYTYRFTPLDELYLPFGTHVTVEIVGEYPSLFLRRKKYLSVASYTFDSTRCSYVEAAAGVFEIWEREKKALEKIMSGVLERE